MGCGRFWVAAILAGFMLSGCIPMGGTDFPKPSDGFTPKGSYAVSQGRAFQAVIAALNANSIPIASANQATGQTTSEYIAGKGQLVGLGLVSADHTRYRYTVFIISQGKGQTTINVSCALEISQNTGETNVPFHDVTTENTAQVKALRDWLYEQIEKQLA